MLQRGPGGKILRFELHNLLANLDWFELQDLQLSPNFKIKFPLYLAKALDNVLGPRSERRINSTEFSFYNSANVIIVIYISLILMGHKSGTW